MGAPAEHAQPREDVVVVGVAAAQMPRPTTLERVTSVQDAPVVEPDEVAGAERRHDLESWVARHLGEDAQRLVRTRDVGVGHVGCAADRVERTEGQRLVGGAAVDDRADPTVFGVGGAVHEDPFERGERRVRVRVLRADRVDDGEAVGHP